MNIAFIIFNRPKYTQKVFDEIKKARPQKLFVIADGPRTPEEAIRCKAARKIIDQVDWDCEVHKNYSPTNLGCKMRVASGISWFFEHVEEGIILEDDCVPDPTFFGFASDMLERYRDNAKIMMVAGSNSLSDYAIKDSYIFSKYFAIWGWATWRRAWQKYDLTMQTWPSKKRSGFLNTVYVEKYMVEHTTKLFDQAYNGEVDTWDTQWFYACLVSGGYSIVPKGNLISNIGIEGTRAPGKNQNLTTHAIGDLVHPHTITVDAAYDHMLYENNYKTAKRPFQSITTYVWQFLYRTLRTSTAARKAYRFLLSLKTYFKGHGIFKNVNHTHHKKNALMLYITQPFTSNTNTYEHQNIWQTKEIASVIGEFGYNVDVVNFYDKKIKLTKNYGLVLDIHPDPKNIYRKHLALGAKKIAYITGSNPAFSNKAENDRLDEIYKTTGTRLRKVREVGLFDKPYLTSFDAVFMIGNNQTRSTYDDYNLANVHLIPNTGYDFLNNTDFSKKSPKHFLFLSGGGQVHKGLHFLLAVFAKHSDLHLYVCSDFASEPDFCELYKKELFATPNIHPVGRISITSDTFKEITDMCTYIVSPSCSEGISGAVLTGMSAGLIPIVSKESGFDSDDAYILDSCEPEYLAETIRSFSEKPTAWIESKITETTTIANTKFSNEKFTQQIRDSLKSTLENTHH